LAFIVFAAVVLPVYGSTITYVYDGPPRPIPADSNLSIGLMDSAVINITDHRIISDINVAIDITHTNVFDLEIMLQGPNGREIYLNAYYDTKSFFNEPNYSNTIFDDEAALAIEQAGAPFTGRFRPMSGNLLSTFDGADAFGQWRLRINDLYHDDKGYLENFELIITVPEPATFVLFTLAGCLLRRRS